MRRAPIPHGIDASEWRQPASGPETSSAPCILSVSSIYHYKNHVRLIQAWTELAMGRPDLPDLVIVGDAQETEYADEMEAARIAAGDLADRIHVIGEVPHSTVRSFYRRAALFVLPSYLETFGFPLIEAMASGVPVVASDLPVFREVATDAAAYADPHDPTSIAAAMEALLYTPGLGDEFVKRGLERVREYTWERAAVSMARLFEDVVGRVAVVRPAASPSTPAGLRTRTAPAHPYPEGRQDLEAA